MDNSDDQLAPSVNAVKLHPEPNDEPNELHLQIGQSEHLKLAKRGVLILESRCIYGLPIDATYMEEHTLHTLRFNRKETNHRMCVVGVENAVIMTNKKWRSKIIYLNLYSRYRRLTFDILDSLPHFSLQSKHFAFAIPSIY